MNKLLSIIVLCLSTGVCVGADDEIKIDILKGDIEYRALDDDELSSIRGMAYGGSGLSGTCFSSYSLFMGMSYSIWFSLN